MKRIAALWGIALLWAGCHLSVEKRRKTTFQQDVAFLKSKDPNLIILRDKSGNSQVAFSAKYQGKVFTATLQGITGASLGWIGYEALNAQTIDPHMSAYGGASRLWLGPEGNQYAVFFLPQSEFTFDNWKTPAAIDHEEWRLVEANEQSASAEKKMTLTNYQNFSLSIQLTRTLSILEREEVSALLNMEVPASLSMVAYRTTNQVTNIGEEEWTRETGTVCLWVLDMFPASDKTTVVLPYREGDKSRLGKVATTDYFGKIPADRVQIKEGALFFKADGKQRSKLGMTPLRTTGSGGSYDAESNLLTLVLFDWQEEAAYLNQEWKITENPYEGDAVTSYNAGPLPDGSQSGKFYEIESIAPAAFLKPQETQNHTHTVIHFSGAEKHLNQIAQKSLNVSLEQIKNALSENSGL